MTQNFAAEEIKSKVNNGLLAPILKSQMTKAPIESISKQDKGFDRTPVLEKLEGISMNPLEKSKYTNPNPFIKKGYLASKGNKCREYSEQNKEHVIKDVAVEKLQISKKKKPQVEFMKFDCSPTKESLEKTKMIPKKGKKNIFQEKEEVTPTLTPPLQETQKTLKL